MKRSSHKIARRVLSGFLAFFLLLLGCDLFLIAQAATVDGRARTLPSYAKESLAPVLEKDAFSEADYDFLYRQTGLGRIAVDELKGTMSASDLSKRLSEFQDALFFEGNLTHYAIADYICYHDKLVDGNGNIVKAPILSRKPGDVLITASTHTIGWAHGHAAIMLEGGMMLQSTSIGCPSQRLPQSTNEAGISYFNESANFLMLRLKDEVALRIAAEHAGELGIPEHATAEDVRVAIARLAEDRLEGIDYSLVVGVLTPKNQGETPRGTQCSHLVWQAFSYFGLDIDSDGGLVVTPQDIARCDLFDVVQVYGFDPETLW